MGWGENPEQALNAHQGPESPQVVGPNTYRPPLLQFLGDLVRKGNAKRIYTPVLVEGSLNVQALLDTGSEISLMSADTFAEVTLALLPLGKQLLTRTCDLNIVSFTQNKAPITRQAV